MMATATPRSLHLTNTLPDYSFGMNESPIIASRMIRVQRQQYSPPRLPAPPPAQPTTSERSELGSPDTSLQPQVGPLRSENDDLESLKQLMISPHMLQSGKQLNNMPSVHQLHTEDPHSPLSPSPSPLPPPETGSGEECFSPQHLGLRHYQSLENLSECASDEEDSLFEPSPSPSQVTPGVVVKLSDVSGGYARITREGLGVGGVYGGMDGTMSSSIPVPSVNSHQTVTRQHQSLTNDRGVVSTSPPIQDKRGEFLLSPEHEPLLLGKTRPVPPPRQHTTSPPPHTSTHRTRQLHSTVSSPALFDSERMVRSRSVSFLQCDAGDDIGSVPADYLGCREINTYTNFVNTVAKQLVNSRAVEVVTYVTSEKVRLAPPRNSSLLFKSFAVKDILAVEICSKNRRILGILVWKRAQSLVPICHILRCHSAFESSALCDALVYQTQQVDEVPRVGNQSPPLHAVCETPPNDNHHTTHEQTNNPPSPTDLLHKLPTLYVGSARAGKLHSVSEVIDRVLGECQPAQSQEVGVWLSLSQLQLVTKVGDREEIYAAHETSRIRAIGVCGRDKRYMGYIMKEVGKPLTGHVLRCTSAALMVSLMSFLRQSCQLMVLQRGGSFYDELSADESEDFETSTEGSSRESSKFMKRIRSLTMSISSRHTVTPPTLTRPSFQSHTFLRRQLSPANDMPQKKRNAVQNPLLVSPHTVTDEDYAQYTVTFVGSAALYLPFCQESLLDALKAFKEEGVAAGKAAVAKNSIEMQVSALSVSLSDKTRKLFVARHYSRKQIQGFCVHPTDSKYFAFATLRPGFPNNMKVHVFIHGEEPSSQIVDSLQYWLEISPSTS